MGDEDIPLLWLQIEVVLLSRRSRHFVRCSPLSCLNHGSQRHSRPITSIPLSALTAGGRAPCQNKFMQIRAPRRSSHDCDKATFVCSMASMGADMGTNACMRCSDSDQSKIDRPNYWKDDLTVRIYHDFDSDFQINHALKSRFEARCVWTNLCCVLRISCARGATSHQYQ